MGEGAHEHRPILPRWLLHVFIAAAVLALLYYCRAILAPFVLGLIIAYILDPFLDRLQARGWSRERAIRMVFLLAFLVAVLVGVLVGPPVVREGRKLFLENIPAWAGRVSEQFPQMLERWNAWLSAHFPQLAQRLAEEEELRAQLEQAVAGWAQRLPDTIQRIVAAIAGFLWSKLAAVLVLFLTPLTAYYFMQEIDSLRQRALLWFPEESRAEVQEVAREINAMLAGYFRGQLVLIVGVFCTTLGLLHLANAVLGLGMQYLLLVATVYGVFYVIPIIGATAATIFGALLAYFTSGQTWQAPLVVVLIMIAINVTFDNLIAPRVVGRRVGVHPLVVLFAILAGAQIMGILGMIVAAPVAATIKILLHHYAPEVLAELHGRRAAEQKRAQEEPRDKPEEVEKNSADC